MANFDENELNDLDSTASNLEINDAGEYEFRSPMMLRAIDDRGNYLFHFTKWIAQGTGRNDDVLVVTHIKDSEHFFELTERNVNNIVNDEANRDNIRGVLREMALSIHKNQFRESVEVPNARLFSMNIGKYHFDCEIDHANGEFSVSKSYFYVAG
jgi:hypothetical protein